MCVYIYIYIYITLAAGWIFFDDDAYGLGGLCSFTSQLAQISTTFYFSFPLRHGTPTYSFNFTIFRYTSCQGVLRLHFS